MRRIVPGIDSSAMTGALAPTSQSAGLVVCSPLPADRHPVAVYLASLAPGSRRTMRQALNVIASMISAGTTAMDLPWHDIGYRHVAAIRAKLAEVYAPSTGNKTMAALKGVVRQAFALGLLDADTLARVLSVKAIKGTRISKGRAITQTELKELFSVCDTKCAGGARDAALLGVGYGAGLRRSEIVGLDLSDYDRRTGILVVRGKGNKERQAYVTNGSRNALETWLAIRGEAPGAMFHAVNRAGRIARRRMSDQAVYMLLVRLAVKAKVDRFAPHDLRRSFIGDLLDAGADISTVAALCAHANVATTMKYDRRGERTRRRAAELLHVPFEG
jgi:integrase/recombinase XerD